MKVFTIKINEQEQAILEQYQDYGYRSKAAMLKHGLSVIRSARLKEDETLAVIDKSQMNIRRLV